MMDESTLADGKSGVLPFLKSILRHDLTKEREASMTAGTRSE